jgi:hypothetical protein
VTFYQDFTSTILLLDFYVNIVSPSLGLTCCARLILYLSDEPHEIRKSGTSQSHLLLGIAFWLQTEDLMKDTETLLEDMQVRK